MEINQLYKETFDSLQISDETLRKVRNMNNKQKTKKIFRIRYAMIMSAIAASLVISNGVVYAATGETIVNHITKSIKIIDSKGQKEEVATTKENGNIKYEFKGEDGCDNIIEVPEELEEKGYDVEVIEQENGLQMQISNPNNEEKLEINVYSDAEMREEQIDIQ